jgi:hypothetical protein
VESKFARQSRSFEDYKRDAEASGAEKLEVIRGLHSKLAEERRVSVQRYKDIEKAKVERDTFDTQARILRSQLQSEREASEL